MMQAAIHGRIGRDPQELRTKSDTTMVSCSVAVEVGGRSGDYTLWVDVIGFNQVAEDLLRHRKGDMIGAYGKVQLHQWIDKEGKEREKWQLVANQIMSARNVRSAPGGRRQEPKSYRRIEDPQAPYNDRIGF